MSSDLALTAYLNMRFQWTADVSAAFAAYSAALAAAQWRLQVRPLPGSPVVTLDFMTGGSPQSPSLTASYDGVAQKVAFRGPQSIVGLLPVGTYAFDYGFVLTAADFERAGGGTIQFLAGVTLAGVVGTPLPPAGADDTVFPST